MTDKISIDLPLNRVEGDLEVRAEIADGVCSDAWCAGTMFRGFERILRGRGPLDGLVITPRICGICSTAHLTAAVKALEDLKGVTPPPRAVALRNAALMAEHLQSDVRQSILTFAADFVNEAYRDKPLYEEAVRRYAPFAGDSYLDVLKQAKKILEIVAILGGQWPHTTFMVPGGITSMPTDTELLQCRGLLERFRKWYETRILGCSIERWLEVESREDLQTWLDAHRLHAAGELGFFLRYGRAIGLDKYGVGPGNFLSLGALDLPEGTAVQSPTAGSPQLVPAGFAVDAEVGAFAQTEIAEHVAHSWYAGEAGGAHPSNGTTEPYATGHEGAAYSWAKAPRYAGQPAETGPIAEAIVAGNPLFVDLLKGWGPTALLRQLARLTRPAALIPPMQTWLAEALGDGPTYAPPGEIEEGEGVGLTHASRGALGHWVRVHNKKIEHYQIITPTAWHASPRDTDGVCGPIETALRDTPVKSADNPVELAHVVRSFDPCLVCTVHTVDGSKVGQRALEPA